MLAFLGDKRFSFRQCGQVAVIENAAIVNQMRSCDQSCDQTRHKLPRTKKAHLSVSLSC